MPFLFPYLRPAFAVAILSLPTVLALESSRQTLTLTSANAPALVRAQNPALAAARYRVGEARGRLRQSGRLTNPEVESSFQHDPEWREIGAEFALTQSLPVTARLRHEKEVSLAELQAAIEEVNDFERRLIGKVREGIVDVVALQSHKANHAKQVRVVLDLLSFIEAQVEKGERSVIDANQVKVERTQLGLEMRRLENARLQALGQLKPLLGLSPDAHLIVDDRLPPMRTMVKSSPHLEARPDYRAAFHLSEAAEREIALERAKRYDDLSVGLFVERAREEDAPDGLERETAVGVRVSFPLPFWTKNEGAIEEKMAKHARLTKEMDALAKQALHETSNAEQAMESQAQLLAEIDASLMPEVRKQVEALEEAYEQGLTDLQSVLRARRQVIELSAARIDALRDYHRARVQLETALATP